MIVGPPILPIVAGEIHIHTGDQPRFLDALKAFTLKFGFKTDVHELHWGVDCYDFQMFHDDLILMGQSKYNSEKDAFDPMNYRFSVRRNFLKPDKPGLEAELHPIAEALARDLKTELSVIAEVTIEPAKM